MSARTSIICVDDDPVCLDQLRLALSKVRGDLHTRFFHRPEDALTAHETNPADIVISDLRMGAANGIDLIAKMRYVDASALYILLSGDADLQSALAALNEVHVFRFLIKPANAEMLQLTIDAAVTELNLQKLRRISIVSHAAVEKMSASIAYLDSNFRVIYCNKPAKEQMERHDIFDLGQDKSLRSAHHRTTLEFHELLYKLRTSDEKDLERGFFRFSGASGAGLVVASVVYHPAADLRPAYYSVLFSDPEVQKTTAETIAAALNILPSEARVVQAIAEGLTVEQAAASANISVHSARTYLRSVYEKTGVARQSELTRLVLLTAA